MLMTPYSSVTVAGVLQDAVFEWHTDSVFDTPSTADVVVPAPAGAEVQIGAEVVIEAAADVDEAAKRVFRGRIARIEPGIAEDGRTANLRCDGYGQVLSLPLESDIAFAGGAKIDAQLLTSQVVHIGDETIAWYADTTPDGTTFELAFNPRVDARFVRVTGRLHGTNSWPTEPDRDIEAYSQVQILQDDRRIGYANLPSSGERWNDQLDYTDDANWTDFDLTIGCRIDGNGGNVKVKFTSGRKPGTSERDDYEVKDIAYETAGRQTARDLVRAVLRNRGFGPNRNGVTYRIAPITDLNNQDVLLGGNGLVANGRIEIPEGTDPWQWLVQLVNMWGYHLVDGPDALEVVPARGIPTTPPSASYTEGVDVFSIMPAVDAAEVATVWRVTGASGSDENGEPFRYESRTDEDTVTPPSYLPDPPGMIRGEVQNALLTSDELAESVRAIAEVEYGSVPIAVDSLSVPPNPSLRPGVVISLDAPSVGIASLVYVTGVRHDFDSGGFWTEITARAGTGAILVEDDPATDPRDQTSTATKHVGGTDISWYARPNPDGLTVDLPWHPGADFRGVRVTGRYHGANSWPTTARPTELLPQPERDIAWRYMNSVYATDNFLHADIEGFGEYGQGEDAEPFRDYIRLAIDPGSDPGDVSAAFAKVPAVLQDFAEAVVALEAGTGTRGAVNRYTMPTGNKVDMPSEVHVWQLGTSIGSAPLPWNGEAYDRRRDYDDDQYWRDFDVMIAADVTDASADIRFTSGTSLHGVYDDYEVKDVSVTLYAEATEAGAVARSGADWHAYQSRRIWRWAS